MCVHRRLPQVDARAAAVTDDMYDDACVVVSDGVMEWYCMHYVLIIVILCMSQ